MFLYLVVLTLVKTCTLSTSPGEDEYQTKLETLEVKQELVSTASKLLHEDMVLIQRAMKNYHQLNLEQFKNFSNGFLSSSLLHNNFTKSGMDSLHSLLTNIAQEQEYHKTQIQTLSNKFINNMTMMASRLSEIETELTDVLSNQRRLDNKVEKVCNATMAYQNASKECPEGWKRYQNHCFFFSTEEKRWNEAKKYCKLRKSSLAKILTEDVQNFFRKELETIERETGINSKRWIGLNDKKTDGTWVWNTLTGDVPVAYSNWAIFEPSGSGDCICLSRDTRAWYDRSCSDVNHFICELTVPKFC